MANGYAVSRGTKCRQFLFSVSLNPPETENVRIEVFEQALAKIEERNGLTEQPRIVVFHEKEGRRHCHAVWSRIDAESMTAKPLPHFKLKLRDVAKELYVENGWKMPRGFIDQKQRDPRNFTLDEWQQAKRHGHNAKDMKALVQECWAASDSRQAFASALQERGLYLARGDRRGHVAVTYDGEVHSIARMIGKPAKDIVGRLGDLHRDMHRYGELQRIKDRAGLSGAFGKTAHPRPQSTQDRIKAMRERKPKDRSRDFER